MSLPSDARTSDTGPATGARAGGRWAVLVIVCLAQLMVMLDATIVNVAVPSIQRSLGFSALGLQWVVNAYTLAFGGFLLLGGRLADLLGRKRLFIAGAVLFSVASLVNGLAHATWVLIAGRAVQGLGSALVSPAALSIVTTTFEDTEERAKALGVWSGIASAGGAIGLLLGGILTEGLSWSWIFLVNVPVGAVAVLFAWRLIQADRPAKAGSRVFDLAGAVTVTAGLLALAYTVMNGQEQGWTSSRSLGFGAAAVVLLGAFVVVEQRSRSPLIRLQIFRVRTLTVANVVLFLVASAMFAVYFFLSIYLQQVLGYGALPAGLAFLPVTAGMLAGAVLAQRLVGKFGVVVTCVLGLVLAAIGLALLMRIDVAGSYAADVLPGIVPLSLGLGVAFVPITLLATSGVPAEDAGLASGLYNTTQQVGGAFGLAVLSTVVAAGAPASGGSALAARVDGFRLAFGIGAVLLVCGVVLLALVRRVPFPGTQQVEQ